MKLGFCTNGSIEDLQLGKEIGFDSVSLILESNSPLLPNTPEGQKQLLKLKELYNKENLEISAIGFYPNYLAEEYDEQQKLITTFKNVIETAAKIEIPVVCTFAGRDPQLDFEANFPIFQELFNPLAQRAGELNIKIAFENYPDFTDGMKIGNLAATPFGWEMIFEALPYKHIGLEYDPSHLFRLGIDYIRVLNQYKKRIFHVHAKDGERIREKIFKYSIYDNLHSIYRDRFPGLGEIDWRRIVSNLYDIHYQGNIDIEGKHDPIFNEENEEKGLRIAHHRLSSLMI
ncbi:MAG: sugar phosphate isomerase/epimerase [Spirochaetes bacterium]|nr:sugar phosphate isomerase/epimerase [Spirochaetota bacterium]